MANNFKCGLCKNIKDMIELRGRLILFDTLTDDAIMKRICKPCYYKIDNVLKSVNIDDRRQKALHEWGVIVEKT